MGTELIRRTEVHELTLLGHCSTSSWLQFDTEGICEMLEVIPGSEVGLAETHGDGRIGCELLKVKHALEDRFEERSMYGYFSDIEANNLVALADHEDNAFESDGLLTSLLETRERPGT